MCACCQVSLGEIGVNCETNSWQPRRLLRPPDLVPVQTVLPPPPLPPSANSTKGFNPRLLHFGGNKKVPFYFVRGLRQSSRGCCSVFVHAQTTNWEPRFRDLWLDGPRRPIHEQTVIHWRSWLKWLTSSHSAVFQNGTQDEHRTRSWLYVF